MARDLRSTGSHLSGEADKSSSSLRDVDPSRGPSFMRRVILCKLSLCETFKTASDEYGIWGECQKCGRRVGYVNRADLRRIGRREYEAEMQRREASRC